MDIDNLTETFNSFVCENYDLQQKIKTLEDEIDKYFEIRDEICDDLERTNGGESRDFQKYRVWDILNCFADLKQNQYVRHSDSHGTVRYVKRENFDAMMQEKEKEEQ